MIILDATTEKLQFVLAANKTTTALDYTTSFVEYDASGPTYTPINASGTSNDTTDVDIVGAPSGASIQRQVKQITIYNADTVNATITIKKDTSGTEAILFKTLLRPQDTAQYTDGVGWRVTDAAGQLRYIPGIAPGTLLQTTVYTSGTSHTMSANTRLAFVRLLAGGGGGGGVSSAAAQGAGAGGGSAGGYAEKLFAVSPGTAYTYAVGALGAGGTSGANNGSDGGDTTFAVGSVTVTANKGKGGTAGTSATTGAVVGGAAAAVSTNGDVNGSSEPGEGGFWSAATIVKSGKGGSSIYGGGGNGKVASGAGNAAIGRGAGGGGACQVNNGGAAAGGDGTAGQVIIDEYA